MTLAETWTLLNDATLNEKCASAALAAAQAVVYEDAQTANHANRLLWAAEAFSNPVGAGQQMVKAVVAYYMGTKTLAQMNAISDSDIQAAVNGAVNVFATGS